jgi:hypothetical protein
VELFNFDGKSGGEAFGRSEIRCPKFVNFEIPGEPSSSPK